MTDVRMQLGCCLICLDVPEGTHIGLDYRSWVVGPRFKGIKLLPSGIHYMYWSSQGSSGPHGTSSFNNDTPPDGVFFNVPSPDISPMTTLVWRWDIATESIIPETDEEQTERLVMALMEFEPGMAAYCTSEHAPWPCLTSHISAELITCLGNELTFIDLPKHAVVPLDGNVTAHNIDKTCTLEHVKCKTDVLGELQLSFVAFLVGQSYKGFERWKSLLSLLCSCERAIVQYPDMYTDLLAILHFQLKEVPVDFFFDDISRNNFLTSCLGGLFISIEEVNGANAIILDRSRQLQAFFTKRFDWDFSLEAHNEDAPTIVV